MKDGDLGFAPHVGRRPGKVADMDTIQSPTMAGGGPLKILAGLSQGNVEAGFTGLDAAAYILEGKGCFPGAGVALDQVEARRGETTHEDFVEALNSGGDE
jgi:TRAP-type uncharacterized transport system substrate-binding protein